MQLVDAWWGDTDKGQAVHNYLPFYERHLIPADIETLTEIGVWTGGSLRMWGRWLPDAHIVGIDIDPSNYIVPTDFAPQNVTFIEADATTLRPDWWSDVIIDDGSHHGDDQCETFANFWPWLRHGGWYVVEDLGTVWHDDYRAGDEILSWMHHRLENVLNGSGAGVSELHAYEQILFVRKR